MKSEVFDEFTNLRGFNLIQAVKRGLGDLEVEDVRIYTFYDIDFWREIVEIDVLLKDRRHVTHREYVECRELLLDVDATFTNMNTKFEAYFMAKRRELMQIDTAASELTHIHYLTDKKWVCEEPGRLGEDFVVMGISEDGKEACKVCGQLLMAHNAKESFLEKVGANKYGVAYVPDYTAFDRRQGALWGALISSAIWIILITIFFVITNR